MSREHLVDRPGGLMSFRFILQPMMASILGVRDGTRFGARRPLSVKHAMVQVEDRPADTSAGASRMTPADL